MSAMLEITCLCGSNKATVQTTTTLPFRNITCSCNICRYCTGVLHLSTLHLKEGPIFVDRLREYRASRKVARYFCGECGSHVLILDTADNSWQACAGVVDRVVDPTEELLQLEQYIQHEFIGDTTDGGLMICLAAPQGRKIPFSCRPPKAKSLSLSSQASDHRLSYLRPGGLFHRSILPRRLSLAQPRSSLPVVTVGVCSSTSRVHQRNHPNVLRLGQI